MQSWSNHSTTVPRETIRLPVVTNEVRRQELGLYFNGKTDNQAMSFLTTTKIYVTAKARFDFDEILSVYFGRQVVRSILL